MHYVCAAAEMRVLTHVVTLSQRAPYEARARVVRPLIFSAGPDGIAGLDPDASPLAGARSTPGTAVSCSLESTRGARDTAT